MQERSSFYLLEENTIVRKQKDRIVYLSLEIVNEYEEQGTVLNDSLRNPWDHLSKVGTNVAEGKLLSTIWPKYFAIFVKFS